VPFNAANFFGAGGLTWTVDAAAISENRYAIIGNTTMVWSFYLSWFAGVNLVGGTAAAYLMLTLPGGRSAAGSGLVAIDYCSIPGVPVGAGCSASMTGGAISIAKTTSANWTPGETPGLIATLVLQIV
jgi:hypothetical protein